MNAQQVTMIGKRYQLLEKIGGGGMGVVHRAFDRLTGQYVAIKQVSSLATDLAFSLLDDQTTQLRTTPELALANEFATLARLRHPNIISVLDYGFTETQQPYFTMDLLTDANPITVGAGDEHIEVQVKLLIQVLQALAYLHRYNIIHRDLKPGNILLTVDDKVKVLDFGLARTEIGDQANSADFSGTLAYLAPEIFSGASHSVASDLYAFGLIAYEMLSGRFPYNLKKLNTLPVEILSKIPDYSLFEPDLGEFLAVLLDKDPAQRYPDIQTTIDAFCRATGYQDEIETLDIRESFLQSAPLVGRTNELSQIQELLIDVQRHHGGVWLVAGESGVGKSRLMEELRVRALVKSLLVARGQAIAEGSNPYRLWHEVLRWLILLDDELTDLEASFLKDVVPDIDMLIGRNVNEAPEQIPEVARERLTKVVLDQFQRQSHPMVIILEDLHWTGQESLDLLKRLTEVVYALPVLVVASYRDDEVPDLPNQLPLAKIIHLGKLDTSGVRTLSESILGQQAMNPKLIELLQRETEGNIFFVIEALRELAQQAGELYKINEMPVPDEIIAGDIMNVLQKRLDRVPEGYHPLLTLAAVIGREIDQEVLTYLEPDVDIDYWLLICANFAIFEVRENEWRFSHDKLRERLLHALEDNQAEMQQQHRRVAEAIEVIYPNDKRKVAALAHHWTKADDMTKAVPYLEQAAQQAWRGTSYQKALNYMQAAIAANDHFGEISDSRHAMRHSILGLTKYGMGDLDGAEKDFNQSLKYLNFAASEGGQFAMLGGILRQIGLQVLHRLFSSRYVGRRDSSEFTESMLYTFNILTQIYWYRGDVPKLLHASFVMLNALESLRPSALVSPAPGYARVLGVSAIIPLHNIARYYRRLTRQALEDANSLQQVDAIAVIGAYAVQLGDWDEALTIATQVMDDYRKLGDMKRHEEMHYYVGMIHEHMGELGRAKELMLQGYAKSKQRKDEQVQFLLYSALLPLLLRMDRVYDFEDLKLLTDEAYTDKKFAESFELNVLSRALHVMIQAIYYLRIENHAKAWQKFKQCLELTANEAMDRTFFYYELYELIPWLCHYLLEHGDLSAEDYTTLEIAYKQSVKTLLAYGKLYVYAQARAHLRDGWFQHYQNQHEKAVAAWQQALTIAQDYHMRLDEGLAYAALAHAETLTVDERRQHHGQAVHILKDIGAESVLMTDIGASFE